MVSILISHLTPKIYSQNLLPTPYSHSLLLPTPPPNSQGKVMDRSTMSPRNSRLNPTSPSPTASSYSQERNADIRPSLSRSSSSNIPQISVSDVSISSSTSSQGIAPPFSETESINSSTTSATFPAPPTGPNVPPPLNSNSTPTPAQSTPFGNVPPSPLNTSYSTGVFDSDSDAVSVYSTSSSFVPPTTTIGEIIKNSRKVSIDANASVEQAFELLTKHNLNCVPVSQQGHIFDSFDYADLTGYLLLVLGHITVKGEHSLEFERLLTKARNGVPAPVHFAAQFGGGRDPFVRMSADSPVANAFEKFARGVHRLAVTNPQTSDVIGLLSQRQLVRYVWEHPRHFNGLEWALENSIEELKAGTYGDLVSVQGDQPLLKAFDCMHEHAVSSVAVVDSLNNLLGNISVVDVGLVTRAWQAGLLKESCKHFLTVVLDHRSLQDGGNESVPVFYVHKQTKLAKVIATMVSTGAHRLWICEKSVNPAHNGKLIGVISLTDVLNVVMRLAGLSLDPEQARRNRRSSSSSVRSTSSRHSLLMGMRPRLSFNRERPN